MCHWIGLSGGRIKKKRRTDMTYEERELATVSVIAALGESVEPMLHSHISICRKLGMTKEQLDQVLFMAKNNAADCQAKDR